MVSLLWPFKVVHKWEKGVWYIWGRYVGTVGPGIYPYLPFFMDLRPVSVVKSSWGTTMQTITLRDNRTLTFSAMVTLKVEEPDKALNNVEEWPETTIETVSGLLAEELAAVEPDKFEPQGGKRRNLLKLLVDEANKETLEYGVRVLSIRFNNFAIGLRAYRLLMDRSTFAEASIGVV